jgi:hypothetical protein
MIRADYNIDTDCTCSEPGRVMGFENTTKEKITTQNMMGIKKILKDDLNFFTSKIR